MTSRDKDDKSTAAKTWKSCQNAARRLKPLAQKTQVCHTRVYVALGKNDVIHHHHHHHHHLHLHRLETISETVTVLESRQRLLYITPSGWWCNKYVLPTTGLRVERRSLPPQAQNIGSSASVLPLLCLCSASVLHLSLPMVRWKNRGIT